MCGGKDEGLNRLLFLRFVGIEAIYLLGLSVKEKMDFRGKNIDRGLYFYIGSDKRHPQRLLRHLRRDKKIHWHIDILTSSPKVSISFYVIFPGIWGRIYEKKIAEAAELLFPFVAGFGSTDTGAKSHLFRIKNMLVFFKFLEKLKKELKSKFVMMIPGYLSCDEEPGP